MVEIGLKVWNRITPLRSRNQLCFEIHTIATNLFFRNAYQDILNILIGAPRLFLTKNDKLT